MNTELRDEAPSSPETEPMAKAWDEAEALVGRGRLMLWASLIATPERGKRYVAKAKSYPMVPGQPELPNVYCYGETPTDALRALINNDALRAVITHHNAWLAKTGADR